MTQMKRKMLLAAAVLFCISGIASAKDYYVSLSRGKNKNPGTKEAPLKNLWKALSVAKTGDVIRLSEGNYPGRMKCGWFKMSVPVSIYGGYSADFSSRDPLKYKTMFQPKNENNDKKGGGHGLLHIEFEKNPYVVPIRDNSTVKYASKQQLVKAIREKYPPKESKKEKEKCLTKEYKIKMQAEEAAQRPEQDLQQKKIYDRIISRFARKIQYKISLN